MTQIIFYNQAFNSRAAVFESFLRGAGNITEAPPVADEARWFRGSVPIFTPQRGWKPADTTVCAFAHFSSWWEKYAVGGTVPT